MDVKELFNSESKSQVYAILHELLQRQAMEKIGIATDFNVLMANLIVYYNNIIILNDIYNFSYQLKKCL